MGVRFVKDLVTVAIDSEGQAGYLRRLELAQASGRSSGNVFYVYDKGNSIRRFSVSLEGLSGTEKTALHAFFEDTVNGMEIDFTYTDEAGDAWNAHFLAPDLVWEKHGKNLWMVKFDLETWS